MSVLVLSAASSVIKKALTHTTNHGNVTEVSRSVRAKKRKVIMTCNVCGRNDTRYARHTNEARTEAVQELNKICKMNHCQRMCQRFRFTCGQCHGFWEGCHCLGMAKLNAQCGQSNCERISRSLTVSVNTL